LPACSFLGNPAEQTWSALPRLSGVAGSGTRCGRPNPATPMSQMCKPETGCARRPLQYTTVLPAHHQDIARTSQVHARRPALGNSPETLYFSLECRVVPNDLFSKLESQTPSQTLWPKTPKSLGFPPLMGGLFNVPTTRIVGIRHTITTRTRVPPKQAISPTSTVLVLYCRYRPGRDRYNAGI